MLCLLKKSVTNNDHFPTGSYWKTLDPGEIVADVTQEGFHGPTEDPNTQMQQPAKHNFTVSVDRPTFTGKCKLPFLINSRGGKKQIQHLYPWKKLQQKAHLIKTGLTIMG